ncbi:MAG TPA: DM13 domain-containing protein [Leptolyngbyaceae cyanobacterium M65_K2018_010]|nr:DM13 domain-containing protein [Leptolyngbyaceae cyanobacterium M65_K2018_010]
MLLKRVLLLGCFLVLTAACVSCRSEEVRGNSRVQTTTTASTEISSEALGAVREPETSTNASKAKIATDAAESGVIKSGSFISGEHATSGIARIVNNSGQLVLELDQTFETSPMGPDLVVVLHRSEDVIGSTEPPAFPLREGDYAILAELESFSGGQRYLIPTDVNLDDYRSVAIWCRRFNATFGAATLQ